jgi:hypothetical protein
VFRDYSMRQREAHAVAMGLGGEEGDEDSLQVRSWYTWAGVTY